ncbi:putative alpha/beta hydrolase-1, serine aminopeptidase, S33 [Helianthus annuus]|uniref:Alpha/beta hydrolase-1, serine aminopeptidase, S33 n=1 Tax=Helianthus annuus TaxID=4232 RepID=A0A251T1X8_HELAN|nr:putative alpha/beta hydrolase-1, serine aminopeptidase, S33 [Helianthus annuus]KAJ0488778.1 putative alpha/beta hydrolase-1, serine aminopeptidase, S33 [Helianthus annuus]KAJ0492350.1 putative alpha/beta hydrolase-1, serine aminopeptidase, S33 [Helianthus annuus]KAJ0504615.1 putative alpha/beta hydrolase-1, serine aminopeptidase, S33 [Helianthus annuus]
MWLTQFSGSCHVQVCAGFNPPTHKHKPFNPPQSYLKDSHNGNFTIFFKHAKIRDKNFYFHFINSLYFGSCLEWRYTLPLLEQAGFEAWAIDILGWGFSDLETLPVCNVESKRDHLYQFWKSYIKRPMLLVGPSLGAAAAVDFAINHPEAASVDKLILINASVYAKGTGNLSKLPRSVALAGVRTMHLITLCSKKKFIRQNMYFG